MQLLVTIVIAIFAMLNAGLALKAYLDRRKGRQELPSEELPQLVQSPPIQPIQITPETLLTAYAVGQWVNKKKAYNP